MKDWLDLVVFDMSGTTIEDRNEVLDCFIAACAETGIPATPEHINTMMGWSKITVFRTLWLERLGPDAPELEASAQHSFLHLRQLLESYYRFHTMSPAPGAEDTFRWLRSQGIRIALNTGFYREVTDILLHSLGWDQGLDTQHIGDGTGLIDVSITSDEVPAGRPAPDMIHRAMHLLGLHDPRRVIVLGDTPSDLQAGRAAGCRLTLGVCNGSHSREQLTACANDGLLEDLCALRPFLEQYALSAHP
jgi:phosphonatase-like hydrolase